MTPLLAAFLFAITGWLAIILLIILIVLVAKILL